MRPASASACRARPLLGTFVEISADGASPAAVHRAVDAAFHAVARIHRLMSVHEAGSDLSRLNRAEPGRATTLHPWTRAVLSAALALHTASGGLFDVTAGASPARGGGGPGFELLTRGRARRTRPGVTIDLGGIAKGFAVDRAVEALCRHGIAAGQVNAGGDLSAFGPRARAVDIRDPRRPEQPMCRIELDNAALASSAGRFDPMRANAASGSAVIDPVTALPAQAVLGATVCAPSCVIADALTKVVMNAGEAAAPVLEHYGASALFVSARGDLHVTADWKNEVRLAA
jgi:thiamine biosynthesis lipoprotein